MRQAMSLASGRGAGARLSILIFHRVHARADGLFPAEPDSAHFDRICSWLARWFEVLPLDAAVRCLAAADLPARAACITFDDGYADNHDVALPILQRHRLTATFFVATGYLDGGRMFNDSIIETVRSARGTVLNVTDLAEGLPPQLDISDLAARRNAIATLISAFKYRSVQDRDRLTADLQRRAQVDALPNDLMMRSAQVRALHEAGMQIGAHTVTHPILARMNDEDASREITESRHALEQIIEAPVPLFAYPNGRPGEDYSVRTVELARAAGFSAAVSTARGFSVAGTDPFQLPRFTPWDRSAARFGLRLLTNLRTPPQPLLPS
jgi:peptidoglycan/xylan/chitin deacetylase (PgdA/CDA1 family)